MAVRSPGRRLLVNIFDKLLLVLVIPSALILKLYRRLGSQDMNLSSLVLKKIGVFPIRNHYYEPSFKFSDDDKKLLINRKLPGIKFNVDDQIHFLENFTYKDELLEMDLNNPKNSMDFRFNNGSYESGDVEALYQFIRYTKPKKIIEIGSGNSTKIASSAVKKNKEIDGITTKHICVEPFEMPWLDSYENVNVIRKDIQSVDFDWSEELQENDLLFVDSTHMIKPNGDVLDIYLKIFPLIKKGVNIHIHDIFSPNDYLEEWLIDDVRFWNEQYLVEAILSNSNSFEVLLSLNHLWHTNPNQVKKVCPYIDDKREPGSLYLRKI
tara:strand:+ start:171 stop:1139 length:969 start_codon:yes stop_codon:yes gene_type:complete